MKFDLTSNLTASQVEEFLKKGLNGKYSKASEMAATIITITFKKGSCNLADIIESGFTPKEAAAHWHMAEALASVELSLAGILNRKNEQSSLLS